MIEKKTFFLSCMSMCSLLTLHYLLPIGIVVFSFFLILFSLSPFISLVCYYETRNIVEEAFGLLVHVDATLHSSVFLGK